MAHNKMMRKTAFVALLVMMSCLRCLAQADTLRLEVSDADSLFTISSDSVLLQQELAPLDTLVSNDAERLTGQLLTPPDDAPGKGVKRDWNTWVPNPQRAMWLALVIPGGGQIYNRKFWKLPLVYGGFLGCIYAMTWNNMMYKDYSQAYLDIADSDPTTASYNKFLHLGRQITDQNMSRYKDIFRKRKDKYRRWRDLSFFVMVGVYALSVVDAYVDAELSVFDISHDLSLKVQPTVIGTSLSNNPIYASSLGLNCQLNF